MTNTMAPCKLNFAVAPGRYIKEYMEYYDLSFQEFADRCNCEVLLVQELVVNKAPLTLDLAKKIEKELDMPADLLMRIEVDYRSRVKPTAKVKEREKKASSVVKQPFTVAQQFG